MCHTKFYNITDEAWNPLHIPDWTVKTILKAVEEKRITVTIRKDGKVMAEGKAIGYEVC